MELQAFRASNPSDGDAACSNSPELARTAHSVLFGSCGIAREAPPSEELDAFASSMSPQRQPYGASS